MNKKIILLGIVLIMFFIWTVQGETAVQLKPGQLSSSLSVARITPIPIQETIRGNSYYLTGDITQKGIVKTGGKDQDTTFEGEIRFLVTQGKNGEVMLSLDRLNLVSKGVMTEKGDSGVIGINLEKSEVPVRYDPKTGEIFAEFTSILHYALIDEVLGFTKAKSEEEDLFISQTETLAGQLTGRLPEQLKVQEKGSVALNSEIIYKLEKPALGLISEIRCVISIADLIWSLTAPSDVLMIQPVFIGTGPADPTRTGKVYEPLIRNASNIWGRCGTVRCISLQSKTPIYINNNDYKVLNSQTEATNLRAEVNDPTAVEIFIVDRWDPYYDGGGACWSSGTASAKIVTCDQQLDVPCPPPAGLWRCDTGFCGAVNYFHLGHELGHAIGLAHYGDGGGGLIDGTSGSIMDASGFCWDNPGVQSAKNCRSASSPLFTTGRSICTGSPDIMD